MSLNFNMLSRFVIAFLPRSMCLLVLWLQSLSAVILKPKKRKSVTASTFPLSICHEVMGLDAMILVFLMLSFKPALSHSSFIIIQRLFSSSSLSAIRMVSSAHLRLLIFLLAILIPACDSSSPAFCMIHLACVLAKSLQSSPTLCNLVDCSLPTSSVHGILQARILESVAMPSSRGSSLPRD